MRFEWVVNGPLCEYMIKYPGEYAANRSLYDMLSITFMYNYFDCIILN